MSEQAKVVIIFTDKNGRVSSGVAEQAKCVLGRAKRWWDKIVVGGKTLFYYSDRPISRKYIEEILKTGRFFQVIS